MLIADDHALLREGIAEILRAQDDFQVVGEASNGAEAVVRTRELAPDIVLMDLSMPGLDGLGATRILTSGQHDWKIVILTVLADKGGLIDAINAGASGYLVKTMHAAELLQALRRMLDGEPALAPALAGCVIEELRRLSVLSAQATVGPPAVLTRREEEVLALVAGGASDQQIARTLSVSLYTVKSHVRNILAKLNAHGRREAARYARREGLLHTDGLLRGRSRLPVPPTRTRRDGDEDRWLGTLPRPPVRAAPRPRRDHEYVAFPQRSRRRMLVGEFDAKSSPR